MEIGRVASVGVGAMPDPMMPPRSAIIEMPALPKAWPMLNRNTLRERIQESLLLLFHRHTSYGKVMGCRTREPFSPCSSRNTRQISGVSWCVKIFGVDQHHNQ